MTLQLDQRRRAMLAEMGIVTTWLPMHAEAVEAVGAGDAGLAYRAEADLPASDAAADEPVVALARVQAVPALARMARAEVENLAWGALDEAVAACRACDLCGSRRNVLFGAGDPQPDWLVVGEPPGEDEDVRGEPFVGDAGRLLDNMLRAVGVSRSSKAYLTSVLKCRPPGNRAPTPEELAQCEPLMRRQVQLLQPKVIVAMGRFAIRTLLGSEEPMGKLRGRGHSYQGVPVVVTYRPEHLLRQPGDKARAWADLCLARSFVRASELA